MTRTDESLQTLRKRIDDGLQYIKWSLAQLVVVRLPNDLARTAQESVKHDFKFQNVVQNAPSRVSLAVKEVT